MCQVTGSSLAICLLMQISGGKLRPLPVTKWKLCSAMD